MPVSSLKMRMSNHEYIDTRERSGLRNYTRQSKEVYEEHKDTLCNDLGSEVLGILKG